MSRGGPADAPRTGRSTFSTASGSSSSSTPSGPSSSGAAPGASASASPGASASGSQGESASGSQGGSASGSQGGSASGSRGASASGSQGGSASASATASADAAARTTHRASGPLARVGPQRRRSRVELTGTRIDDVSMDDAIAEIERLIARRQPEYVVTPNVDHLVKLQDDAEFRAIYDGAALVLADGMPLLWASRALGTPLRAKVSGSDLFVAFAAVAARRGHRVYFLGGRDGAAARAAELLVEQHPGLVVCGVDAPPFGFDRDPAQNAAVLARVRDAQPDVLFVGLGAPKQEKWIHRWRHALGVPVSIGVGVSFEFVAGMVRRAPPWMQHAGLEWLWRLLMEPRRLWRRYLLEDTRFLGLFLAQWWRARALRRAAARTLAASTTATDLVAPLAAGPSAAVASPGLATAGLATSGLATSGLATSGLATSGRATAGLTTAGLTGGASLGAVGVERLERAGTPSAEAEVARARLGATVAGGTEVAGPSPLPGWPLGAHGPRCERACCVRSDGGARERTTHDIVPFPALGEPREPDREAA